MNDTNENPNFMSYRASFAKLGTSPQNILFAANTIKFNRHNKSNERSIVFTKDNKIFKVRLGIKFMYINML